MGANTGSLSAREAESRLKQGGQKHKGRKAKAKASIKKKTSTKKH